MAASPHRPTALLAPGQGQGERSDGRIRRWSARPQRWKACTWSMATPGRRGRRGICCRDRARMAMPTVDAAGAPRPRQRGPALRWMPPRRTARPSSRARAPFAARSTRAAKASSSAETRAPARAFRSSARVPHARFSPAWQALVAQRQPAKLRQPVARPGATACHRDRAGAMRIQAVTGLVGGGYRAGVCSALRAAMPIDAATNGIARRQRTRGA